MSRPVFIHPNPHVLGRLSQESKGLAKVTPSMVEALRWITDHEESISGIYLCPDDSSFSAFQFLEIALTYRPAIPIYLFEPTLHHQADAARRVQKSIHIQGFFVGTESYATLVAPLQTPAELGSVPKRLKPRPEQEREDYTALPIADFFTSARYPYDLFVGSPENKMTFFAAKNSPVDPFYLGILSEKGEFLYVRTADIQEHRTHLRSTRARLIDDRDFPENWKTAEVLADSKTLLQEIKGSGLSESGMENVHRLLQDLLQLVTTIETDDGSVSRLIEKAKNCDRSVFCATNSMMICRHLKFEKLATLEILGVASILQDISLYKTPHGDLSDRTPDTLSESERQLYLKHPISSADLIAQHTDVPQVTLQVIRQQHERKDRSGFPSKVGGTQLHPMAEILSLTNAYYDLSVRIQNREELIAALEKNVLPHYSEAVISAFRATHP